MGFHLYVTTCTMFDFDKLSQKWDLAIHSRTVWTLIIIFVFNGLQAIEPMLSANWAIAVNAILSIMAGTFKVLPSQDYTRE